MQVHLEGDMPASKFVQNLRSLGESELPDNPPSGLTELQHTVAGYVAKLFLHP